MMKLSTIRAGLGLVFGLFLAATVMAAPGGVPGKPGDDGGHEGAGNNLSFPVLFTGDPLGTIPNDVEQGAWSLAGQYFLWDGQGLPCDPAESTCFPDQQTDPSLIRAYIQKDEANDWQAYWASSMGQLLASHVDIGDNLEAVPWRTTSVVRVEFVPFGLSELTGFEMVYVSGQGTDEVWGVRGSNEEPSQAVMEAPGYATLYSACAGLSLTKLEPGGGDIAVEPDPEGLNYSWDPGERVWVRADGQAVAQSDQVEPFSAELNVKGRVIYGYNWMMKRVAMIPGVSKDGWWRVTFYNTCAIAPFDFHAETQLFDPTGGAEEAALAEAEEPPEGGTYPRVGVVDVEHELVYIDLYIQASNVGGGGGGGGKGRP